MADAYAQYRSETGPLAKVDEACFSTKQSRVCHFMVLYILGIVGFIIAVSIKPNQIHDEDYIKELQLKENEKQLEAEVTTLRGKLVSTCGVGENFLFGDEVKAFTGAAGTAGASGHHYQFVGGLTAEFKWEEAYDDAIQRCFNGKQGYLVTIESAEENRWLTEKLMTTSTYADTSGGNNQHSAWIGASDMNAEGDWEWAPTKTVFWHGAGADAGGGPVNGAFDNFHSHEPNDSSHVEDCVVLFPFSEEEYGQWGNTEMPASRQAGPYMGGTWNDDNCYKYMPFFIVEFEP